MPTKDAKARPEHSAAQARGRAGRRERHRSESNVPAPAYVTRRIPYTDFLDGEALAAIEQQADWLLEEIGIEFREDPKALVRWRDAGADVKGTRVHIPAGLARSLLKTAPQEFVQHSRNPAKTLRIGGRHSVFAPMYGAPFVRDLAKGRRYGSLEDLEKLVKITSLLPSIHHSGFVTCEPCDIPVNKRHLDMLYTHMRFSEKPSLGAITEKSRAEDCVEMAKILHGPKALEEKVVIMGNVNTNSPMLVDKVVTEAIEVYCGANQGIIVAPFILGGAMGPVTTAAALAQALAEGMACGAYSQLIKPGSAFILGNFLSSMSLKSGAPTFGMPEAVMSNYAIGQLARRLGLPLRCGGALTAAKIPDAQAGYESADSLHSTILGGANFILHAAGWMEGGLSIGYEKLVLDADRLGAMEVLLRGFASDENALARDAYREVEPGGHFLGCTHTLANYETAYYDAQLSDSESVELWEEKGAKSAAERAYERWNQLLRDYEEPRLEESVDEELRTFVARRKEALPDAWY